MPLLQLRIAAPDQPGLAARAAALVHRETHLQLGKDPQLTAVSVDLVDPATWFIAGEPLSASGQNSFSLVIRVTDETNTQGEKARFIAAVFAGMAALLQPLHPESYIHVLDARAAAYGWGGRTQAWRAHHPPPTVG